MHMTEVPTGYHGERRGKKEPVVVMPIPTADLVKKVETLSRAHGGDEGILEGLQTGVELRIRKRAPTTVLFWGSEVDVAAITPVLRSPEVPTIVVEKLGIDYDGRDLSEVVRARLGRQEETVYDQIAGQIGILGKAVVVPDIENVAYSLLKGVVRGAPANASALLRRMNIISPGTEQPIVLLNKLWQYWLHEQSLAHTDLVSVKSVVDLEVAQPVVLKRTVQQLAREYPGKTIPVFYSDADIAAVNRDLIDGEVVMERFRDLAISVLVKLFPQPRAYVMRDGVWQLR